MRERDPDLLRSAEVEDGIGPGVPAHRAEAYARLDPYSGSAAHLRARALCLGQRLADLAPDAARPAVPEARTTADDAGGRAELAALVRDLEARIAVLRSRA